MKKNLLNKKIIDASKKYLKANKYILLFILGLIIGYTILFVPLLNAITTNQQISLKTFAIINFSGYLFFIISMVELAFIQVISQGGNPVIYISIAVITAMIAQTIDYAIGYYFSKTVMNKFITQKKYEKYKEKIEKYGNPVIFLFNFLPLSSPILILIGGILRYNYKKILLYSFLGLLMKYVVITIFILHIFN